MKDQARAQLREMIEGQLGRGLPHNLELIEGVAMLASAFANVPRACGDWVAILEALRDGIVETRAALEHSREDASLARSRVLAERRVSLACNDAADAARRCLNVCWMDVGGSMNADASTELAKLVTDHLGRSKPEDLALSSIALGLARIGDAFGDIAERKANWSRVLDLLERGSSELRSGVGFAAQRGPRDAETLIAYAKRQLAFAALLHGEIIRLQAGESTLV